MNSQDKHSHCIKINSAIDDLKKTYRISGVWSLEGVISGYCSVNNLNEDVMKRSYATYLKNNRSDVDAVIVNKYVEIYDR